MKLSDIKNLKECLVEEANKLLKDKWELVKIVKMQTGCEERLVYVLGKTSN